MSLLSIRSSFKNKSIIMQARKLRCFLGEKWCFTRKTLSQIFFFAMVDNTKFWGKRLESITPLCHLPLSSFLPLPYFQNCFLPMKYFKNFKVVSPNTMRGEQKPCNLMPHFFLEILHFEESRNLTGQKYFNPYLKNQVFPTFGNSAVT